MRMAANDVFRNKILIFDPNKSWKTQIPKEISSPGGVLFHEIVWSPDGEWLAGFDRTGPGPFPGLGVYSLKFQTYQTLTNYWGGASLLVERQSPIAIQLSRKAFHH